MNAHTVKHKNKRTAKGARNQKATKVIATQSEAENVVIKTPTNQKSDVIIYSRNGKILEMNSYVNHPRNTKG
jgi:hypothetical protein